MSSTASSSQISSLKDLDEFICEQSNTENVSYISEIPDICKEYPCMLGIDEAGRGPVLGMNVQIKLYMLSFSIVGPMVYGIAVCCVNEATTLENLGCADSKALNEEKRDEIFSKMLKSNKVAWSVEIISPKTICNSMLQRSKCSLNEISMNSAIGLIKAVEAQGVKISYIYVDTVGPPEKYQSHLSRLFPKYGITVAKKADSTYAIVSAASICAKVTRDHALKVWKCEELDNVSYKDFGSGYPSDPVTKQFLRDNCNPVFGFPNLVRFSWSTASAVLEQNAYNVEFEETDEKSDVFPANSVSITSFFKSMKKDKTEKVKHEFFRERYLNVCNEL